VTSSLGCFWWDSGGRFWFRFRTCLCQILTSPRIVVELRPVHVAGYMDRAIANDCIKHASTTTSLQVGLVDNCLIHFFFIAKMFNWVYCWQVRARTGSTELMCQHPGTPGST
jgi:hypothetical protein